MELGSLVHEETFGGERFLYFEAAIVGGGFGTGEWLDHAGGDAAGTHEAVWLPLGELADVQVGLDVRPAELVRRLLAADGPPAPTS